MSGVNGRNVSRHLSANLLFLRSPKAPGGAFVRLALSACIQRLHMSAHMHTHSHIHTLRNPCLESIDRLGERLVASVNTSPQQLF